MAVLAGSVMIGAAGTDADETLYMARFATMMSGHGDVYDTMEAVPGAAHPEALAVARTPSIGPAALEAARDYARDTRSTALIVWHRGAIQMADYFAGATAETRLISKSLAKPLTAIVVGRAIALGYIRSLDEKVSDFLPEWRGGPKDAILVRHLLDMRTGMLGQAISKDPTNILNRVYLHPHHDAILMNDYPLVHPPGTRFDYANAVADLVALVIERATHERYAAFVSGQVLQKLGAAGGEVWLDREGGLAHSGCCMKLPAESWLRLAILLLQGGVWHGTRLLPVGYVAEMRHATPENPYYGLGVYVAGPYIRRRPFGNPDAPGPRVLHGAPYLARDLYLFDGNSDQVVYIVPSADLIILRMGATPPPSPEWDNVTLPNLILQSMHYPGPPQG